MAKARAKKPTAKDEATLPSPSPSTPTKKGPKRPPDRMRAVEILVQRYQSAKDITRIVSERFGCTERTVYADIQLVWEQLAEAEKDERGSRKAQMRSTMRRLYETARKAGDLKNAIATLDRLCKLDGLYDAVKVEHSGKVEHLRSGDQRARLETLLSMVQELGQPNRVN
jgi:hypothetical protein